ncbi:hypothetical protein DFH08DRAFT_820909 [Mycena albidolilacea]|uniref:Uncharacterized protein n=1 Tax=Mycena albidolilacea TaxID=1033008 RepID=A0AAD6ZC41_9AGAR|nr:hypothetical protein DFH08DRAFT_820909 [Mycena albidolilacea]
MGPVTRLLWSFPLYSLLLSARSFWSLCSVRKGAYSGHSWTLQMPPLKDLCAILKTSDFFVVPTGMAYAVHYLDKHMDPGSALQFHLGCDHHLPGWIAQAFNELIMGNPLTISPEDQELLGRDILLVLTQTHAKVTNHCVTLAVCPPEPIHGHLVLQPLPLHHRVGQGLDLCARGVGNAAEG